MIRVVQMLCLLLTLGGAVSAAPTPTPWTDTPVAQELAATKLTQPIMKPPVYTVDMDAPAQTRWSHINKDYASKIGAIVDYFDQVVPAWALPIVEKIASSLTSYFHVYGEEMEANAKDLNVSKGLIVMMNLIMQLEELGVNCSNWNETGPTRKDDPGCVDVDPSQEWCYCHEAQKAGAIRADGYAPIFQAPRKTIAGAQHGSHPGLCTSVVSQANDGVLYHGRNLDWNMPPALRAMIIDIDFVKSGKKVFRGTGSAGVAGLFNGMAYSGSLSPTGKVSLGSYSVSIDARGKGGKLLDNILQALLVHSMTPSQHLRYVLEQAADFESAVTQLSTTPQIDENYFIVAGTKANEGAVIARGREKAVDVWRLDTTEPDGWFRLQTNYDHWNPPPAADDRRTPGVRSMENVGRGGLSTDAVWGVITTFPVFNGHTDYSLIAVPSEGIYNSTVWMGA